jgi:hypothetical protein
VSLTFDDKHVSIATENELIRIGSLRAGHYRLSERFSGMLTEAEEEERCIHDWHRVLAHRNLTDIKVMQKDGLIITKCDCSDECEPCLTRKNFPKHGSQVNEVLDLVVSDVWLHADKFAGRLKILRDIHRQLQRLLRSEADQEEELSTSEVIRYVERMKTQHGKKPKVFRSDRGNEYLNHKLQEYLANEGIKTECTVGYCPEHTSVP